VNPPPYVGVGPSRCPGHLPRVVERAALREYQELWRTRRNVKRRSSPLPRSAGASASSAIETALAGTCPASAMYWGAAGFSRNRDDPWFTEDQVRARGPLCQPIAEGLRRTMPVASTTTGSSPEEGGPGLIAFDEHGHMECIEPPSGGSTRMTEVFRPTPSRIMSSRSSTGSAFGPETGWWARST
jgi:hypothetical protein